MADAPAASAAARYELMAGERGETTEIEDVLDRLEVWHRATSPSSDGVDDDRSEHAARR